MSTELERHEVIEDAPLDTVITEDFITRLEIAADLYQKRYLPLALRLTNEGDWIRHEGRGGARFSLQASGAEKLCNPFGIVWDRPIVTKHAREDAAGAYYEYEVEGIVKAGALRRWGWFTGNCSSRDQFFTARGRFDEGDIRKAAFSNFLVNGVARLIGIRNPTAEMLTAAGLNLERVVAPDYSGKSSRTVEQGASDTISEAQAKRFWAIARDKGWDEGAIAGLLAEFKLTRSTDIPRRMYDELVGLVSKPPTAKKNGNGHGQEAAA
ncbi:MAG TPA: hypothetical protein VGF29_06745 [Hyphomicrobiaceae bacterium]|jgi:hypothetical protein